MAEANHHPDMEISNTADSWLLVGNSFFWIRMSRYVWTTQIQ